MDNALFEITVEGNLKLTGIIDRLSNFSEPFQEIGQELVLEARERIDSAGGDQSWPPLQYPWASHAMSIKGGIPRPANVPHQPLKWTEKLYDSIRILSTDSLTMEVGTDVVYAPWVSKMRPFMVATDADKEMAADLIAAYIREEE